MRKSIIILLLVWSFFCSAQNNPYCLNDTAGFYRLATINTTTGVVNNIAPLPGVSFYVLGNKQCISTHDSTYIFSGHDGTTSRLYTIDLVTGSILNNPIFSPSLGNQTVGLRYNCLDSSIYALTENPFGYSVVKVDKITGAITTITPSPLGISAYVSESFTLDVKRSLYHFFGLNGSNVQMYSVNINTGLATVSATISDNVTGLAYNCNDSTIYGLWEDGLDYKLERIIPTTGAHSTIGILNNIESGFVAESAAISRNGEYTYRGFSNSNAVLVTLDVQTASIISNVGFTSNVTGIDYYNCCADNVVTSIEEYSQLELSAFPNPFTDKIELGWGKSIKDGNITVYDVYGKVVFSKKGLNGNSFTLNKNQISKGIYFVEVKDENQFNWVGKIVAE